MLRLGCASNAGMLTSAWNTSNTDPCRGDLRRVTGAPGLSPAFTIYRSRAMGCTSVTGYDSNSRDSLPLSGPKPPVWISTIRPPVTTSAT